MTSRYDTVFAEAQADPEAFWARAADDIDWSKRWDKVFDAGQGIYGRWFVGAECNTCYNCVDRHVERGRASQAAIILSKRFEIPRIASADGAAVFFRIVMVRLARQLEVRRSYVNQVSVT